MRIALNIHILSGALVLILGLSQIILRKSGKRHRIVGSLYTILMIITAMSAIGISVFKIFKLKELAAIFLFAIGCFSLYLTVGGWFYAHFKTKITPISRRILITIGMIFSLVMACTTCYFLSLNKMAGLILGSFTAIQTLLTIQDFRASHHLTNEKNWLRLHIIRMISSFIAATTAFLVNAIETGPVLLKWLGPSVVGTMVIIYFTRKKTPTGSN